MKRLRRWLVEEMVRDGWMKKWSDKDMVGRKDVWMKRWLDKEMVG